MIEAHQLAGRGRPGRGSTSPPFRTSRPGRLRPADLPGLAAPGQAAGEEPARQGAPRRVQEPRLDGHARRRHGIATFGALRLLVSSVARVYPSFLLGGTVTLLAILTGPTFPGGACDAMVALLAMSTGAQLAAVGHLKVRDLLTVVLTMTITGALTERGSGRTDPGVLRRPLALVAFAVGALCGALLVLHLGTAAALLFGLAIIIGATIAAHVVSRAPSDWYAPQSP